MVVSLLYLKISLMGPLFFTSTCDFVSIEMDEDKFGSKDFETLESIKSSVVEKSYTEVFSEKKRF